MSSWSSGYVTDIGYTHGFYRELTPAFLSFAALARGVCGPNAEAPLTYCELGCGQGFSTNLLAAANPHIVFHACDINPGQIAGARMLAAEAGLSNVTFHEASFGELMHAPDVPASFDIISLHGIYSWISAEARAQIVAFIRQRLKPGGLAYVSYNTLPGWAPLLPLRRLLIEGASDETRSDRAAKAGIAFAEKVKEAKAGYFANNPAAGPRLQQISGQGVNYLAHEYLNRDWNPFYFSDVAAELSEAKLTFMGSASLLEALDDINLTPEQLKVVSEETDLVRRETLKDFMVNQQFRRDVFVKGAVPCPSEALRAAWLDLRLCLNRSRDEALLKIKCARGEASLHPDIYNPLFDALASGPRTVRELLTEKPIAAIPWAKIEHAIQVLVGTGQAEPCLSLANQAARQTSVSAFNRAVVERAKSSAELSYVASAVTAGGVSLDRISQLFVAAQNAGASDPVDWAWALLTRQGQRLLKDGKPLESAEANVSELRERFQAFEKRRHLPMFFGSAL